MPIEFAVSRCKYPWMIQNLKFSQLTATKINFLFID